MALYMIQLEIEPRAIFAWARQTGISSQDRGYLVHNAMRVVFGDAAPQPFAVFGNPHNPLLKVLGYAGSSAHVLCDSLGLAEPILAETFAVSRIKDNPMPGRFESGKVLAFRTECCPVTRNTTPEGRVREKDAFLAACDGRPEGGVERGSVYAAWVGAELGRDGAAELVECAMRGFRLFTPVRRKGQGAQARGIGQRPRAVMDGVMRIGDPEAFSRLLTRGLGRHRAFGLGMLLLRPV